MEGKDLIPVLKEWIGVLPTHPDAEKRGYDRLVRLLEETVSHLKGQEGIVRCRDCKYANHETPFYEIWCDRISIGCYEDWFCADGERREKYD